MKIEAQPLEDHQVKIITEVDSETFDQFIKRAARKIAKEAKIPGFRPGKAPFDVVRRLYGEEFIEKEAIELLVDDIYPKVIDEAKITPSGPGSLEEIISTNPPKLAFKIPLAPEVELGDYASLRQVYVLDPITDEELEKTLHNILTGYATAEPVTRPVQKGDLVYFKISGKLVNPPEGDEPVFLKENSTSLEIGSENDTWPYKGFSDELIGLSEKEEKTILSTYPEDTTFENLRGKEVEFHVVIESVKQLVLPELNDEFAKSLGQYETVEDLRKETRSMMEDYRKKDYDQNYMDELVNKITSMSIVKYSPNVLETEIHDVLESFKSDLAQQRMDLDVYLKTRKLTQEKFIEDEITPVAKQRLVRSLILEEIARKEKLELNQKELEESVTKRMIELFSNPGFQKPKTNQEKKELANVVSFSTANRLMNQQIFERLKTIATNQDEITEAEKVEEKPTEEKPADEKPAEETAEGKPAEETSDDVPVKKPVSKKRRKNVTP